MGWLFKPLKPRALSRRQSKPGLPILCSATDIDIALVYRLNSSFYLRMAEKCMQKAVECMVWNMMLNGGTTLTEFWCAQTTYRTLKADESNWLQSIVSKAIRYGFLPRSFCTLDELREDADEQLFFSSRYNPNHVLHRLLPQPNRTDYNLRKCTHNLTLPTDGNPVMKQNFVYRLVFKDIYWLIFFTNVQCYFYYTLLLRDIYCILTSASIHLYRVRLSYVIEGFTYLLTLEWTQTSLYNSWQ